jgi:hypothetical protein
MRYKAVPGSLGFTPNEMNAVFCSRKSLFDGKIRFTNDVLR